jgi:predicted nucleic acid-binding Zn ribbon protein
MSEGSRRKTGTFARGATIYSVTERVTRMRSLEIKRRAVSTGEVPLAQALAQVMKDCGIQKRGPVSLISQRWVDVVGEEIARHATVKGYRGGVLGIEVDSAPWLQELAAFRREEILARLAEIVPEVAVHDLKFKVRG